MKIVSIVGARPEFIQASPVSCALRGRHTEVLVHTGQHYDYQMSQAFFDDLCLPIPAYNLGVGSGTHARQTGEMLVRLEEVLNYERPDMVLVRGDTNSTLAGALAASKMQIPLVHVEAGERSFNRQMPEEINRLVVDRLARLHLCASHQAMKNLADEGLAENACWVGDVMLDALVKYGPVARQKSRILERLDLHPGQYALATVHRAANTDEPARLEKLLQILSSISETIIFPVHPRTRTAIRHFRLPVDGRVRLLDPLSYYDMMVLEENARLIATDSGGVQREAYYLGIPCLTLREETEWTETIKVGWNRLVGVDGEKIRASWFDWRPQGHRPPLYGDGKAGMRVVQAIEKIAAPQA